MNAEITKRVEQLLSTPKKIVVIGHKNPDGDAIGSCLALSIILKALGHSSEVIMPNEFPNFLKWLPECDQILTYDKNPDVVQKNISSAEIIFTLDFNALDRVGDLQPLLESSEARFIMIDHHQAPTDYALITYSDSTMSSTCEMVYHFAQALGIKNLIKQEAATLLYTGIMTDTGSFRYPATTATTHHVIANLVELGADGSKIHQAIYDTKSPDQLRLLGVALNNLKVLTEYNTAYISLSQKELDDHGFKKGDTEGFVNYALSVEGIKFAVIFIENKQENIIKISLRSKGNFSVNDFARNHYNGGGHINAAGGRSDSSLATTITEFISILPRYKKELQNEK